MPIPLERLQQLELVAVSRLRSRNGIVCLPEVANFVVQIHAPS
ncbi:hypothetical protein [Paraburkholderia sp. JPY465]